MSFDTSKTTSIQVLDMTPIGRYADGSPVFGFRTSFPSRNVRLTGDSFPNICEAHTAGVAAVRRYEQADPYGNMGEVLGVCAVEGGYQAVINTYRSNS